MIVTCVLLRDIKCIHVIIRAGEITSNAMIYRELDVTLYHGHLC